MNRDFFNNEQYLALRQAFRGKRLPLAFIDLDAFDRNISYIVERVGSLHRTIRLGTKSIRCEPLMRRILNFSKVYQGFLTYTMEETTFLAGKGHDDFILAYPSVQPSDLALLSGLTLQGKKVATMVDSLEHLQALSTVGQRSQCTISACLELDLAFRPLGNLLHLGLRRSPIRTSQQALALLEAAKGLTGVRIDYLMGYEGHIAGVSDAVPGQGLKNQVMRLIKNASVRELTRRRQAVVRAIRQAGLSLDVVNGGGSGSLASTLADESVTEVTVGSGFYASGLFHHFVEVQYQPAAFFALQVVRRPAPGMVACQGGGYVASGPTEASKAPTPVMPIGLKFLPLEGAGEVSTPLVLPQGCPSLDLGDPVFFQHAKAGELCERFDTLYLLKEGRIIDQVPTYRGEGMNFL
jgi:D-serine deaminase-like pyridoxal phosphate-dependent protein